MTARDYLERLSLSLRFGAARLSRGLRPRDRLKLRNWQWRGIFGRSGGNRQAPAKIAADAVSHPLGESRRSAFSFTTNHRTTPRFDKMRTAAVLDMFDQVGLAPLPGQLWRFVAADPDPFVGVTEFLAAIGVDPARIIAREVDAIAQTNEVLELLFSIDHIFDRLAPHVAARLEERLCSRDFAAVREAAQVVAIFEKIARLGDRWSAKARIATFAAFLDDVRAGQDDPISIRLSDAQAAEKRADRLAAMMIALESEVRDFRQMRHAVFYRWPPGWGDGPAMRSRDATIAEFEATEQALVRDRTLRVSDAEALVERLGKANNRLRMLLEMIGNSRGAAGRQHGFAGTGPGRESGQQEAPGTMGGAPSEFELALRFFGFPPNARPDRVAIAARFRQLARTMHPDFARTDPTAQAAAHQRFVELNRYNDLLKMRFG